MHAGATSGLTPSIVAMMRILHARGSHKGNRHDCRPSFHASSLGRLEASHENTSHPYDPARRATGPGFLLHRLDSLDVPAEHLIDEPSDLPCPSIWPVPEDGAARPHPDRRADRTWRPRGRTFHVPLWRSHLPVSYACLVLTLFVPGGQIEADPMPAAVAGCLDRVPFEMKLEHAALPEDHRSAIAWPWYGNRSEIAASTRSVVISSSAPASMTA